MIPKQVKVYAREDIANALKYIESAYEVGFRVTGMSFKDSIDRNGSVTANVSLSSNGKDIVTASWTYTVTDDEVYVDSDSADIGDAIYDQYSSAQSGQNVKAAVASKRRRIVAADEDLDSADNNFDDFENNFITEDPDDTVSDTLDDLADNVEDMQDQIDDVDEDEPSIDVDNNIEGHYIAECERCHGIFISAMIESDQEVEKISGVCPLCEKETDQYLKWVVKSVE